LFLVAPAPSVVKKATIPFAGVLGKDAKATGVKSNPFFNVTTSLPGSIVYEPDVRNVFVICNIYMKNGGSKNSPHLIST
jgi:hypothetical protein